MNEDLYKKITKILGYREIDDESETDNLEAIIQKYVYGLRHLDVRETDTTTAKDAAANLSKMGEFLRLYDNLNTSVINRKATLENSKTHKLEAAAKLRHIKAIVVSNDDEDSDEEETTQITDDIE